MASTGQVILDAAIASSLANDAARSELASNSVELLNVLNRKIRQVYTLAATPKADGGLSRSADLFLDRVATTLDGTTVLAEHAFRPTVFRTSDLVRVAVVPRADIRDGIAELPPAVHLEGNILKSTGRAGDPGTGAGLTVEFVALPVNMAVGTETIGATTAGDPTTSRWPSAVGDPFLISWLARYLALKAGDREAQEFGGIEADLAENANQLATYLGIDGTRLIEAAE